MRLLTVLAVASGIALGAGALHDIDVSLLATHCDYLVKEVSGLHKMQDRVDLLHSLKKYYNGSERVKQIASDISTKISKILVALRQTRAMLVGEIKSGNCTSLKSYENACCSYPDEKTSWNGKLRSKIDMSAVCHIASSKGSHRYWELSDSMLSHMKQICKSNTFLQLQHITTYDGVLSAYPAHKRTERCNSYENDPLLKPWFIEAVSPTAKKVVMLLDSSYSMSQTHNGRRLLDVATEAIVLLLDSLPTSTELDVVAFNDTNHFPRRCLQAKRLTSAKLNRRTIKQFLKTLTPGGQSRFAGGFQAAFKQLAQGDTYGDKSAHQVNEKRRLVILFISDGDASEVHNDELSFLYRTIRERNKFLGNNVQIITYGVGRIDVNMDLLDKIAKQDFDNIIGKDINSTGNVAIIPGAALRINNPSELRIELGHFYKLLEESGKNNDKSKPVFSTPYSTVRGSIFTMALPVYDSSDLPRAVVAADIAISEIFNTELRLKNDQRSYVFVIDKDEHVLYHPFLPSADHVNHSSTIRYIRTIEIYPEAEDILSSMALGLEGKKQILVKRLSPMANNYEISMVNRTYHWHPVVGTTLSVCIVEEKAEYTISTVPQYSIYGCVDKYKGELPAVSCPGITVSPFLYHRLDLTNKEKTCKYFNKVSTINMSVVKFAPRCFQEPKSYLRNVETSTLVKAYESYFNNLLHSSSHDSAAKFLNDNCCTNKVCNGAAFLDDVISDVIWTASADTIWLKHHESYIVRHFIATSSGVIRFHPGTNLSAAYDPTMRDWYTKAVTYPKLIIFSRPYADAAGAGTVITISHAIQMPQMSDGMDRKVIAVAGLDMSPASLGLKIVELYPRCADMWRCTIVDSAGYIIHHWMNAKPNSKTMFKHIIGEDGSMSQMLIDRGLMVKVRCFDLETEHYIISYTIKKNANLNEMENRDKCLRYLFKSIPNSNIFFLAKEYHSICHYKTCTLNAEHCDLHEECVHKEPWPNSECECPCRMKPPVDNCRDWLQNEADIVTCSHTSNDELFTEHGCLPTDLRPCYETDCKNMSSLNCARNVGCTWCKKSSNGASICDDIDSCAEKSEEDILSIKDYCAPFSPSSDDSVSVVIGLVVSFGVILLAIFIVLLVCYTKHSSQKETYELQQVPSAESNIPSGQGGAAITAFTWMKDNSHKECTGNSQELSCTRESVPKATSRERQIPLNSSQMSNSKTRKDEAVGSIIRNDMSYNSNTQNSQDPVMTDSAGIRADRNLRNKFAPTRQTRERWQSTYFRPHSNQSPSEELRKGENSTTNRKTKHTNLSDEIHIGPKLNKKPRSVAKSGSAGTTSTNDTNDDGSQPRSVSRIIKSVLKKRITAKRHGQQQRNEEMYMESISQRLESDTSYFEMFADPGNNEGDIPIIQSDHSDSESVRNISIKGNVDSQQSNHFSRY